MPYGQVENKVCHHEAVGAADDLRVGVDATGSVVQRHQGTDDREEFSPVGARLCRVSAGAEASAGTVSSVRVSAGRGNQVSDLLRRYGSALVEQHVWAAGSGDHELFPARTGRSPVREANE